MMANGFNCAMLLGNIGADPELRVGQSGNSALKLRLATTESWFDKASNERKERTDWHNVLVFGKRGEALQKLLSKGDRVFVEGRLQTNQYEKDGQKHYATSIVADEVILCGGRGQQQQQQQQPYAPQQARPRPSFQKQTAPQPPPSAYDEPMMETDDIPF